MSERSEIRIQRVYEAARERRGAYFLVDRLWPRGVKKSALHLHGWLKDIAPSDTLRRWFSHDPDRWQEFADRYIAELDKKPEAWGPLIEAARKPGGVTLLYAARDAARNNAVVLAGFLRARQGDSGHRPPGDA